MKMRKLIPCNIVMVLLALVAVITLLFMPLLSVNIGKMADSMLDEVSDQTDGNSDSSSTSDAMKLITPLLDAEISFSTV